MTAQTTQTPTVPTTPVPSVTRTLLRFAVPAVGLTWAVQLTFLVAGWPITPALLLELVVLVATATMTTCRAAGPEGVRRLFAQALRWRFAPRWWALVLLAFPAGTVLVAGATGHLHGPPGAWGSAAAAYLVSTVLVGAVLGNVWEEVAWTGAVQAPLTAQVGLVRAALLTSVPFALIHLPLAFAAHGLHGTTLSAVVVDWAVLLLSAPVFRVLVAVVWSRTRRSILAVALLHGSFNACASLAVVTGGWEYVAALLLVALAVLTLTATNLKELLS